MLEDVFYNISMNTGPEHSTRCIESTQDNKVDFNLGAEITSNDTSCAADQRSTCTINKICNKVKSSLAKKFEFSFDRLGANLYKDTFKCKRNLKLLLVQFLIPIIQITFFYLCIGQKPHSLPLGIINNDVKWTDTFGLVEFNLGQDVIDDIKYPVIIKVKKIH